MHDQLLNTEEAYTTYARYLAKAVAAFQSEGLTIDFLALQNEPLFGTGTEYPGMYLNSSNAVRLATYLAPLLQSTATKLIAYGEPLPFSCSYFSCSLYCLDHNWDEYEYPMYVLSNSTDFVGVAWHCYAGDMATAHDTLHDSFPAYPQYVTECTGSYPGVCNVTQGMTNFGSNHEWDMQNILLGAAAHWAVGSLKWIIALDETCGPTLPTVTYNNGRPLVSIPSTANTFEEVYFNQDYWSIAHLSQFIPVGSWRVESDLLVTGGVASQVLTQSFMDSSQRITCLVMNLNHTHGLEFAASDRRGAVLEDFIPPYTTKVYQWDV